MRSRDFLSKLFWQGKLDLVESSREIMLSYVGKSEDCLRAAKLLYDNSLFENSMISSYYAMYNLLTALLFRIGIKCENHLGSIILLEEIFENKDLYKKILFAKKERIDGQYYVVNKFGEGVAKDMLELSEDFALEMKLFIEDLNDGDIGRYREKIGSLFKGF